MQNDSKSSNPASGIVFQGIVIALKNAAIAGILFSVFGNFVIAVILARSSNEISSIGSYLLSFIIMIVPMTILMVVIFSFIPVLFWSVVLSVLVYRRIRAEKASAKTSMITGQLTGALVGMVICAMVFALDYSIGKGHGITYSLQTYRWSEFVPLAILAVVMAFFTGRWTGRKVYNEMFAMVIHREEEK
jgi:hypothetical protein